MIAAAPWLFGCDLEHFNKCEWTLEPEKDNLSKVAQADLELGYIPVCVRNRVTNKQNCNLKADLDYTKQVFAKKFRYEDLDIEQEGRFPKTLKNIKQFCD